MSSLQLETIITRVGGKSTWLEWIVGAPQATSINVRLVSGGDDDDDDGASDDAAHDHDDADADDDGELKKEHKNLTAVKSLCYVMVHLTVQMKIMANCISEFSKPFESGF